MTSSPRRAGRALLAAGLLAGSLAAAPSAASATEPRLRWSPCGDAGAECATARVPLDYDRPHGRTLDVAVTRVKATDPARASARCSSTSVVRARPPPSTSRPSAPTSSPRSATGSTSSGIDPRGTGDSEGAIDCQVNQETEGVYSQPFRRR